MEDELFDKDNRSKRFTTTNFKKRENKRELDHRNVIIDRRLQQSLRDRYGEDYVQKIENGEINEIGEKINGENHNDFDWSEDEKSNGPKNKKKLIEKKSKADKQKELEEDFSKNGPKNKGVKKY